MENARRYTDEIIYFVYAIGKIITGICLRSPCTFAFGFYFLMLSGIKYGIQRDKQRMPATGDKEVISGYELRVCHKVGAELLFIGILMGVIIMQSVIKGVENLRQYPKLLMSGSALLAFLFIFDAVIHLIKERKNKNVIIFTSNMVRLEAAFMSVLTLQIDMLYLFRYADTSDDIFSISLNGVTGGIVCILLIIAAVYMTIYNGVNDRTWKKENEKIEYSQRAMAALTSALILLGITIALTATQAFNNGEEFLMKMIAEEQFALTVPVWLEALIYGICVFVSYILINYHERRLSTVVNTVVLFAAIISIVVFALSGYHFQFLAIITSMLLAFVFLVLQELILSRLKNKQIENALNMYVDSKIVDELAYVQGKDMAGVTKRKNIAVLFVDIRGFTTLSEQLEPEEIVEILNDYLSVVAEVVQKWGGTLDKFIGDAAMAVFNSPRDQEDYVYMAVCAAREIVDRGSNMKRVVNYGIGINCGEAVVGNIGSRTHMDFTAIGDTVNTASRLEGQAKAGQILISEAVKEEIEDRLDVCFAGELKLKGKSQMVKAYEVTGEK